MKTLDDLRGANLDRLDVYVKGKRVAMLAKEYPNFVLTYLPDADPEDFVSLTMPVRAASWISEGKMHPFFETNLPEGVRRQAIAETFGKAMISEDMSLLALVGSDTIGRVQIVPAGWPVNWREKMRCDIEKAVMADTDSFFAEALNRYAAQGVSGVQPKLLTTDQRVTLRTNGWIIKRDGAETPWLSANEYISMNAAAAAGMNVADCLLSSDGHALYVSRFDNDKLGFEDFCGMLGLSSAEKYSGSMERMLKVAQLVVSDRTHMKEAMVRAIAFNLCIGNSDAHLKNFGVLYENSQDVKLAPFYDLVSVRAFDEFKNDIPALTLGGKKDWVASKVFYTFAANLGLGKKDVERILGEVEKGVRDTIPMIVDMAERIPDFREHAKRMIACWTTGLRRLHGEKVNQDEYTMLQEFGMSGPKFEAKVKKNNPYRTGMGGL